MIVPTKKVCVITSVEGTYVVDFLVWSNGRVGRVPRCHRLIGRIGGRMLKNGAVDLDCCPVTKQVGCL